MPSIASAGNLRDAGTPWDHPKALALGPFATLGLVGTRWDSRDVHSSYVFLDCFAHLGLAGAGAFIILNITHQPQMLDPRYSGATVILFLPSHSEF